MSCRTDDFPVIRSTELLRDFKSARAQALDHPVRISVYNHDSLILVSGDLFHQMMELILADPSPVGLPDYAKIDPSSTLDLSDRKERVRGFLSLVERKVEACKDHP